MPTRFVCLFGGRQNNLGITKLFVNKLKQFCSTQYHQLKIQQKYKDIWGKKLHFSFSSFSIRTRFFMGVRLERQKSQVTDSPQLLRETLHNMNHYRNQQQWILWLYKAKKSKNSGYRFDYRPERRTPSRSLSHRKHIPHVHSTSVLSICEQTWYKWGP